MDTSDSVMEGEPFGRRVRRLRLERGWSLRDLAQQTGISYTHLAKLERGEVPTPGYVTVARLAAGLGTTGEALMEEQPHA